MPFARDDFDSNLVSMPLDVILVAKKEVKPKLQLMRKKRIETPRQQLAGREASENNQSMNKEGG